MRPQCYRVQLACVPCSSNVSGSMVCADLCVKVGRRRLGRGGVPGPSQAASSVFVAHLSLLAEVTLWRPVRAWTPFSVTSVTLPQETSFLVVSPQISSSPKYVSFGFFFLSWVLDNSSQKIYNWETYSPVEGGNNRMKDSAEIPFEKGIGILYRTQVLLLNCWREREECSEVRRKFMAIDE